MRKNSLRPDSVSYLQICRDDELLKECKALLYFSRKCLSFRSAKL
ncbi:Uncharacterized protein dnm_045550 [Desulfonema magnum]|uniref:Uncharacterized protein n=1 Tax=Desulfonema magnum TaxID=45655 RepID=A0A975BNZ4_9BACT|nr:Uncharacterized protein dnm_045550 [Desulfonema magnum]